MSNFSNLKLSELTPDMIEKAKSIIDQLSDKEITADVVSDVIKNAVDFKVDESEIVDGLKSQIGNLRDLLRDERKKNKKKGRWKKKRSRLPFSCVAGPAVLAALPPQGQAVLPLHAAGRQSRQSLPPQRPAQRASAPMLPGKNG